MDTWALINAIVVVFFLSLAPLYPVIKRHYRFFMHLVAGVVLNTVLGFSLKYLFLVPRNVGFGPAFPSFHTQTAFFIATMMSQRYPKGSVILFVLAGLLGIARVEKGLHTPVEVMAGALFGLLFGLWMYSTKTKKISMKEIARQTIHFLAVLVVPLSYFFGKMYALLFIAICVLLVFIAYKVPEVRRLTAVFERNGERSYLKAGIFLGVIAIVILLFDWKVSACSIIALCVGDSVSTIVGMYLGSHKVWYNPKKQWEGTLFSFFAVYLFLFFLIGRELAIFVSLLTAIVETIPKVDDNITIPLAVALFLKVMGV
ncbi:MAG: phosphatase PAP2 family protein [Candidatus Diapherotrites archaeon]|nr:phosphatase PAP2 family protein [Candidatus Diapherotrites archaeon]